MIWTPLVRANSVLPWALLVLAVAVLALPCSSFASVLPIGPEQDTWSDMAFPTGVTGDYNAGTSTLTVSASTSNDLELGPEFGLTNIGRHYGTGGTLGGPFSATLTINGAIIQPDGTVTSGGTFTVVHNNSAPGSIGTDYGIGIGAVLLSGVVTEVLLDATGNDTLDVLVTITAGALQNPNPVNGYVFAMANYGVLRFRGLALPSDFTNSFSLNGATLDLLGVPEPGTFALVASLGLAALVRRGRSLRFNSWS